MNLLILSFTTLFIIPAWAGRLSTITLLSLLSLIIIDHHCQKCLSVNRMPDLLHLPDIVHAFLQDLFRVGSLNIQPYCLEQPYIFYSVIALRQRFYIAEAIFFRRVPSGV